MAYEVLPFPSPEKQKALVKDAEEFFAASEAAKKEREDLYRKAYKMFRARGKKTKDWKFPTFILDPVLFSALKTKSARMKKAIFSANPVVRYKLEGATQDADDDGARAATMLFAHYQRQDKPRTKMGPALEALSLAGTLFVHWYHDYREAEVVRECECEVEEMVPVTDQSGIPQTHPETGDFLEEPVTVMGTERKKVREVTCDRPTWSTIHFSEAFPDAKAQGIHDGHRFIRRTFVDEAHANRMAKLAPEQGGWRKSAVKRALERTCPVELSEIKKQMQWQADLGLGGTNQGSEDNRKWVEVWEVYEQQALVCYTILNRDPAGLASYKSVSSKLGRIPIDMVKCHGVDNEFWGASDFEFLETSLNSYQDNRNAGASETLLSVFGLTTALPGFQQHKLLHQPGAVIPVTSHTDIAFQPRPANGVQIAQNQMQVERASIDEVTASNESFRGVSPSERRTATTDSITATGGALRLQDFVDDFEEQFIVPWGEWWLCDMQENTDPEKALRVLKDPALVQAFFQAEALEVMSGAQSSELRALEDKRLLEALKMQREMPDPAVDGRELTKAYYERLIPEKVDMVVMDDEKMLQREKEKLAIQAELEVEKARLQIEVQARIMELQGKAIAEGKMPMPQGPPAGGMPGGPPPEMPPPMGEPSGIDQSLSEPMSDAGMAEEAAMMGAEQQL